MHSLSLVAVSEGYSLAVAHELLTVVTSRVAEYGFESTGSIVVVQGSSCFVACGIFYMPGIQPVSPALAGGSLPLSHQESPIHGNMIF